MATERYKLGGKHAFSYDFDCSLTSESKMRSSREEKVKSKTERESPATPKRYSSINGSDRELLEDDKEQYVATVSEDKEILPGIRNLFEVTLLSKFKRIP